MKKNNICLQFVEVDTVNELSEEEQELIYISRQMTLQSYAPYSRYFVGAAVKLDNGEIVKGCNQENAAYPSGLCAERVAVFSALSLFPHVHINMLAISARSLQKSVDHPVTPCGACRQVLIEYEFKQKHPIKLLLSGESGKIYIINNVKGLLPLSFTPDELK